jgi:hypothetical protein
MKEKEQKETNDRNDSKEKEQKKTNDINDSEKKEATCGCRCEKATEGGDQRKCYNARCACFSAGTPCLCCAPGDPNCKNTAEHIKKRLERKVSDVKEEGKSKKHQKKRSKRKKRHKLKPVRILEVDSSEDEMYFYLLLLLFALFEKRERENKKYVCFVVTETARQIMAKFLLPLSHPLSLSRLTLVIHPVLANQAVLRDNDIASRLPHLHPLAQ